MMDNILEIKNLHTYFNTDNGVVKAVEGLDFWVKEGETLGLVGESACGKSVTAYSVMRIIEPTAAITQGRIFFKGQDLLRLSEPQMRKIRGGRISLIFQEPQTALNPLYTVGFQIEEAIKYHNQDLSLKEHRRLCVELLKRVGIKEPVLRRKDYPHNLSGGQAQRVMIAMGLCSNPELLIADEPTSNLDVTVQARIMELFRELKQSSGFSLVFITHDLALCSQIADRIAVMYSGRLIEIAKTEEIISASRHPYTKALFSSQPQANIPKTELKAISGQVPDPLEKPQGCFFNPRCPIKTDTCLDKYPEFREISPGHWVSCHNL